MADVIEADVLIAGAGIAGASLAFFLAPHARVVLIERESQPGYHSTGRSAALFIESYGPSHARALTRASRAFFDSPPPGLAEVPILAPRGLVFAAETAQESLLDAQAAMLDAAGAVFRRIGPDAALDLAPCLRRDRLAGAIHEPDAADMDVDALHQGFLRGAGRAGARLIADAEIRAIERRGGDWIVEAGGRSFRARSSRTPPGPGPTRSRGSPAFRPSA